MLLSSVFHSFVVLMKKDSLNCGVLQSLMSKHLPLFLMCLSTVLDVIKSCFVVVLTVFVVSILLLKNNKRVKHVFIFSHLD